MPIDDIVFGETIIKAELLNCLAASDADFSVMELFAQIGKCVFGFWKELHSMPSKF